MVALNSPHWGGDKINFIADFESATDKVPVYSIKGIQTPEADSFLLPISCKEIIMTENHQIKVAVLMSRSKNSFHFYYDKSTNWETDKIQ
jgi:hypothetical protein